MDAPAVKPVKPVNRGRLSKVELKRRLAERNRNYYDKHFVELRERALANYHRKHALLVAAREAEKKALAAAEAAPEVAEELKA